MISESSGRRPTSHARDPSRLMSDRLAGATASLCAFVCLAGSNNIVAQAPPCLLGPSTTAPVEYVWVEPYAPEAVSKQVVKSITGLGYTVVDSGGQLHTAAKFSWPRSSIFTLWRGLVYPGARLTIALEPTGPWTRIHLTARLVCRSDQRPPPGHPQDVDFGTFVVHETHDEAWTAITSGLRRLKITQFAESCAPLNGGDYKIDLCRRMAKAQPRNPEAWRQYAVALAQFYRAREAWDALQHVFALEGERRNTYEEVGVAMLRAREFDDADKLYERAIALWPDDPVVAYQLGRVRLALHQLEPAATAFTMATTRDSIFGLAHAYAAIPLAQLGLVQEARQHCSRATPILQSVLPDSASVIDVWLGLAFCASLVERHRDAASYYARAFELDRSAARATAELVNLIDASVALVGEQPPAPVPARQ
jgi:Tfp pilus assembly protein PilF